MKYPSVIALLLVIIAAGCGQKAVTKTDAKDQGTQQKETQQTQQTKAPDKIVLQKVESVDSKEMKQAIEKDNVFRDILFDYDKYNVADSYKSVAKEAASWLQKNPSARLLVEGHCDERGTNEYNMALGDRRAKAVKDYLAALGVSSKRVETISYGEEKPACSHQSEECWTKNRRAHLVLLSDAKK